MYIFLGRLQEEINNKVVIQNKKRSRWKILLYVILFILFLPILLSLLLQIKSVQNFAVDQTTKYYSSKFDGEIVVGEIDFSMYYGLDLKEFVLKDKKDTIISAESLEVSLTNNLFSLFNNALQLNTVHLSKPKVKLFTDVGQQKSNLDLVIDKVIGLKKENSNKNQNSETNSSRTNFDFAVKQISFDDLDAQIINKNIGSSSTYIVKNGMIKIDKILEDQIIISDLSLDRPYIDINIDGKGQRQHSTSKNSKGAKNERKIIVHDVEIKNGRFKMDDWSKNKKPNNTFDENHLNTSINLRLSGLKIDGSKTSIQKVNAFSAKEKQFAIKNFTGSNLFVSNKKIDLPSFRLRTQKSSIGSKLQMRFNSFDSFKNITKDVFFDADFKNTNIDLNDIVFFSPSIRDQIWYKRNQNESIKFNGKTYGTIDDLTGENIDVTIGKSIKLKGGITSKGMTQKNPYLDINVDILNTNVNKLIEFLPELGKMEHIDKLGNIDFVGSFKGKVSDFKANGHLNTSLGKADVNMNLITGRSPEDALYNGILKLKNFDLNDFLGNNDYGVLSLNANIKNGKGLTIKSMAVDLEGEVEEFDFRGHRYEDFRINGKLENMAFDGKLNLRDPHADFAFDGLVDFKDSDNPLFDFDANIKNLSLNDLNLSKERIVINGDWDVDLTGVKLDKILGDVKGKNVNVTIKDSLYTLENLDLNIKNVVDGKQLNIESEAFDLNIQGKYDLQRIVPSVRKLIRDNHIAFLAHWPENNKDISTQDFDIIANIRDSKNFLGLAGLKDLRLKNVELDGNLNTSNSEINVKGKLPIFKYNGVYMEDGNFDIKNIGNIASVNIVIDSTSVSSAKFNPIVFQADIDKEVVDLHITTENFKKDIERLDIKANIIKTENGYLTTFDNDRLTVLGKEWKFNPNNKVLFRDQYIDIENMTISDGNRKIYIDDIYNKGMSVDFNDFDFKIIDELIGMKELKFGGTTDLNVVVSDIFNIKNNDIDGNLSISPFYINEEDYGALSLNISKGENDDNVYTKVNVKREDYNLDVDGKYNTSTKYVDTKVKGQQFPLKFFKFFIGDGIHDTFGGVDVDGYIKGPQDDIKMYGEAIASGGTTIDYTNAAYHFEKQKIIITENYIDYTGGVLYDANNNPGLLTGKMHHRYFKDFLLDINIKGDDVIVLDTDETLNETYYGLGKGKVSTDFTGPFDKVNMKIVCETKKGTVLNIPVQSTASNAERSFITFINKDELNNKDENKKFKAKLDGIDIEMDIAMTPDANVNLIFDEQKGDIIKGTGNGNLKVYITREGDFNIYGDYIVSQGEYLFTALGLVAKPFTVRPGGLIKWTGDPFNTTLDITADYTIRAPLNVFLAEYLTTPRLQDDANNRTDVNLVLKLGDKLFKPTINFDLNFPDLTGEIASVTDSKMRTLQRNQNELNNQVLGLIVFNSFIPSSFLNDGLGDNALSAGISTLSEFVSSQLSIFVTGLINEALEDNGLISGVDFNIGLKKNSFYGVTSASNGLIPDEIEVNLKNKFKFLDERLSLNLGGNYVREPIIANIQEYFIGDFVLEYYLTNKKNLKLRMYGKYDYDEALADRKMRYGLGIGYNSQFGAIKELKDQIDSDIKKLLEK